MNDLSNFPSIGRHCEDVIRQQIPRYHTLAKPDEILDHQIKGQNRTADYLVKLWNTFDTEKIGKAELVPFPPGSPAYANYDPPRNNVRITIPSKNPQARGSRALYGHFDLVQPDIDEWKDAGKEILTVQTHPAEHRIEGWGVYDMQMSVYAMLRALLTADVTKTGADIVFYITCDEEEISAGVYAAMMDEVLQAVECVMSGEVMSASWLRETDKLQMNVGRPGRFAYRVTCRGRGMHHGQAGPEDVPYLTRSVERLIEDTIMEYESQLREHPDKSGGLRLKPYISLDDWGSVKRGGVTLPSVSYMDVDVYTAHIDDTAGHISSGLRDAINNALEDRFAAGKDREFRKRACNIEMAPREIPPWGDTDWTRAWREDLRNPFMQDMETIMLNANTQLHRDYKALGIQDLKGYYFNRQSVQRVIDNGVADEACLAHGLGVPVFNPIIVGDHLHTPLEWADTRNIALLEFIVKGYIEAPPGIADKNWDRELLVENLMAV